MKKITLLITLALIITFSAEARKIKGRIITENDTIEVTFSIRIKLFTQQPIYEKLQYKVKYFDESGKKKILKPAFAKEIQFTYESENVRMLSRKNTLGLGDLIFPKEYVFLKLEIDGPMKLFNYYFTQSSPGFYNGATGTMINFGINAYIAEKFILQREGEPMARPREFAFRKDMVLYFSDCPELADKIKTKVFRFMEMVTIVEFYNANCAQSYNPAAEN